MMVFTTLFIASIVIAVLYVVVIRNSRWPALSYGVMTLAGIAFFLLGSVHFWYIGIEIAGIGSLVAWMHHRVWRKASEPPLKTEGRNESTTRT